jgi:hypothetical protein
MLMQRALASAFALGAMAVIGCTASVAPCPAGTSACGPTYCFDLSSDDDHCGACDHACNAREHCVSGACACAEGLTRCGDACVMLGTAAHCSACDDACTASMALCEGGACTPCGARGQACCEGGTCTEADDACGAGSTCVACGGNDQPCCDGADCETGSCRADGTCGACGRVGEPCCAGGTCLHPVFDRCENDTTCVERSCDAFPAQGFGTTWSTRGHCSSQTATCTQTELNPTACILDDTTPATDGFACPDCVLYAWLECSRQHGCAAEAGALFCCLQLACPDTTFGCGACDAEDEALRTCNDADTSHCSRIFAGSAIGQCF